MKQNYGQETVLATDSNINNACFACMVCNDDKNGGSVTVTAILMVVELR
jgi:hypothetical protein